MPTKREPRPVATGAYIKRAYTERIADNLLLEPIEYIFADHCRQMDLCRALKEQAKGTQSIPFDPPTAQTILDFLENDLPRHIADEEVDLYPQLQACVLPEDHFPELLRLMDREHERNQVLTDKVCHELARIVRGKRLNDTEQFRHEARTLAECHLSHLSWENAAVLPLARKRLGRTERKAMGRAMAARRGIAAPED